MCIDTVEIWFWIANGQISSVIESYLPATHLYFLFRTITSVNVNGFSQNLICALILWRSGLGLLMGKFRQLVTKLSARDMIMARYFIVSHFYYLYNKTCKGVIASSY